MPCDGIQDHWKILITQIVQQVSQKSGTLSNFQILQTLSFSKGIR